MSVSKITTPISELDEVDKINEIIDNLGGAPSFATITGQPTDNANLAAALNAKADSSSLATVATTGAYSDLTGVPTTSYSADCPALTAVSGICTWTVTHTLATKDVTVRVYEVSTGNTVVVNSSTTATDTVVISILSASDIAAGTYRVVLTK